MMCRVVRNRPRSQNVLLSVLRSGNATLRRETETYSMIAGECQDAQLRQGHTILARGRSGIVSNEIAAFMSAIQAFSAVARKRWKVSIAAGVY